ncbi:alpha/beta hydrolase [Paractinoplanes atraurantiacus]|uniref:S-formylglutathione hydrolase FrmB n=1 Tax=Paractinoplanes atraurantiacus TaxID=1036182 RepID=A0A285JMX3_9ACTN|nr:alpha/beta hydrolase family protein [Actinoplanes atraurantiacus]SNY60451.1 S-formylglutathione hydrolase FrmB [Actinoplanes atraurantiacus]
MALIRVDFASEALELDTSMTVVLPEEGVAPPPLLYLLHGLTDDDTAWTRFTSIERYATAHGLAVVMPQVHRSFYADEAYGMKFWTFLSDELPRLVHRFFKVTDQPRETYVAGLSMGGYGALKWALRQPERFAAAASLSGALDLAYLQENDDRPHIRALMSRVFAGRGTDGTDDDLFHLIRGARAEELPRLMLRCGTEDHLAKLNERFVGACADAGVTLDSAFTPGDHDWAYWDREIQEVLSFFMNRRGPARPGSAPVPPPAPRP